MVPVSPMKVLQPQHHGQTVGDQQKEAIGNAAFRIDVTAGSFSNQSMMQAMITPRLMPEPWERGMASSTDSSGSSDIKGC